MHATRPRDLLEMLKRAAARPGRGLRFFRGGKELELVSYAQLYEDAGRIAGALVADAGVQPEDRIAVVLPTTPDCVRALFGVLAAGAVPVPLPPPLQFSKPHRYAERIRRALQKSEIKILLGDDKLDSYLREMCGSLTRKVQVFSSAKLRAESPLHASADPDAAALVQYTSGSTSAPKGVVLTHRQVLSNLDAILSGLRATDHDIGCSWLPLFHDMGLIGSLYASVYQGTDLLLMPPEDFVLNPVHWLRLFGKFRATIAPAPNAAYLHCVKRLSAKTVAELDLSTWRAAMSGAEGVDSETMRLFAKHFEAAGFQPKAFMPVYGMAEATLAVSFSPPGEGLYTIWVNRSALGRGRAELVMPDDPEGKELCSVGAAVQEMSLEVRGEAGEPLPARTIGEIHIRGGSVMGRYDRDPAATARALSDGWLATGDLGFVYEGRLYITGRRKEMIIVRGQNYYASDLEHLAGKVEGVAMQGAMALSIPGEGTESLVLLIENRATDAASQERIKREVRDAISGILGITPDEIVLLGKGGMPRTSSGKLERYKGPMLYAEHRACVELERAQAAFATSAGAASSSVAMEAAAQ